METGVILLKILKNNNRKADKFCCIHVWMSVQKTCPILFNFQLQNKILRFDKIFKKM